MNEKTRIRGVKSKSQMKRLIAQGAIKEEEGCSCDCGSLVEPEVEVVSDCSDVCGEGCCEPKGYIPSDTEDDGDID